MEFEVGRKREKETVVGVKPNMCKENVPLYCIEGAETFQTSPRKVVFSGRTFPYSLPK
jgi:hypothetical protein